MEDGKYYVSRKFYLQQEEIHLFVEFLVNGIVNLYYFRMPDRERYLLEKEGEPLTVIEGEILKSIVYQKNNSVDESRATIASKSKSQGQITYLLREDPTIQEKVKNLNFDQRSMIKITMDYHNAVCSDYECVNYNKRTNLSKRSIGFFAGISLGNLVYRTDDSYFESLVNVDVTRKPRPVIGINYKFTIPYINQNLCLDIGIVYSGHYFEYYYNGSSNQTLTKYSYKQVAITGQVGYYLIRKGRFMLNHSILYEFIHDLDDISLSSNSHVCYFMIGISKTLINNK